MAAFAGRALRIEVSLDGGTTYTAIVGSTSDNFSITKEGINITDKDDEGVQTFLDDAVGSWAMEGGWEGIIKDDDLISFMADVDQFTYDARVNIGGLATFSGKFGITSVQVTGADGAEAATYQGSLVSSGTIVQS